MTVDTRLAAVRADAVARLAAAGVPSPEVDADLLIGHVLDVGRGRVRSLVVTDARLEPTQSDAITAAVARRAEREPLQHITGTAPFRSIELLVGPGVFIPRPETESVAQLAIDTLLAVAGAPIAVDLGTGSGAIALAIASEVPHATVVAVENSPAAFGWARQNFQRLAPEVSARLVFADLATAVPELDGRVDVVVSNPPYIPLGMIPRDPEVRLFDPEHALFGGADGLDVVRAVSVAATRLLHAGGTLVLEHGEVQAAQIAALLRGDGWSAIATHPDLLGRDRATTAVRSH